MQPDVPRIVLVDTFKDEAEEALRVADALGDRLYGVRLDTPSERGRVTADLVKEVRARLDHGRATGTSGSSSAVASTPERIALLQGVRRARSTRTPSARPSAARSPIDFTGDLKEIDGRPIAKRGRIPGRTPSPRLERINLHG